MKISFHKVHQNSNLKPKITTIHHLKSPIPILLSSLLILLLFSACSQNQITNEENSSQNTYIQDQKIILDQMKKTNQTNSKSEITNIKTTKEIEIEQKNKVFQKEINKTPSQNISNNK